MERLRQRSSGRVGRPMRTYSSRSLSRAGRLLSLCSQGAAATAGQHGARRLRTRG